jgi:hypothetical protein
VSRGVMGTAVVFGMTIVTLIGIFLIPVCYVFVQGLAEWGRKKPADAATPTPDTFRLISAALAARAGRGRNVIALRSKISAANRVFDFTARFPGVALLSCVSRWQTICIQRSGLIIVPPAVTVIPAMPITAVIIVTSAVHVRIPTIRPAAVVDSHVSCSGRSGGSDRTQKGEKKRSDQSQIQQTVPGVRPLPRRIGTAYPITRFAVAHLHILDKGPRMSRSKRTRRVG